MLTRVLLVEDTQEDADFALSALNGGHPPEFTVQLARTCREAVAHLAAVAVDVVLLDLALPDGRGVAILAAVREVAEHVAVVVLTGSEDASLAEACLRAGAQDYLNKEAIDGQALRRAIGYALHRLRGERQRSMTTLLTGYRELSSQAQEQSTGAVGADGAAFVPATVITGDRERFEAVVEAYADLLNRYVDAICLRVPRPRDAMEQVVTVIGECGCGPQELIDVHLAALERAVAREPESRVRALTADGRLMALEMMGILVEYYRRRYRGGEAS